MERKTISPSSLWKTEPFGFSHGVISEGKRVLFISGEAGIDKDVKVVEGFESQCKLAFESIEAVLKEAGASFHNVVKITGYLTDLQKNLATFGSIAAQYYKGDFPAQTLIEVKGLALPGMQVEIEAIAVL
jgi:enamine deaminase RidA (YjgF/YER057c/UK114 family)